MHKEPRPGAYGLLKAGRLRITYNDKLFSQQKAPKWALGPLSFFASSNAYWLSLGVLRVGWRRPYRPQASHQAPAPPPC